jgi:hypothetical protein
MGGCNEEHGQPEQGHDKPGGIDETEGGGGTLDGPHALPSPVQNPLAKASRDASHISLVGHPWSTPAPMPGIRSPSPTPSTASSHHGDAHFSAAGSTHHVAALPSAAAVRHTKSPVDPDGPPMGYESPEETTPNARRRPPLVLMPAVRERTPTPTRDARALGSPPDGQSPGEDVDSATGTADPPSEASVVGNHGSAAT